MSIPARIRQTLAGLAIAAAAVPMGMLLLALKNGFNDGVSTLAFGGISYLILLLVALPATAYRVRLRHAHRTLPQRIPLAIDIFVWATLLCPVLYVLSRFL